jgi:hypothetical protein
VRDDRAAGRNRLIAPLWWRNALRLLRPTALQCFRNWDSHEDRAAIVRVDLTAEESTLLKTVKLDPGKLKGYEDTKRNGEAACALMKSLIARRAIPELRVQWFTDPKLFPGGRGKSRRQLFERNGCIGEEIFRHPHFLEYLHYFLYGADLPASAIEEFCAAVDTCGDVSSSDVVPLGNTARGIARGHSLQAHDASEEFYKLALDCGIWHRYAESIRDAVRKMR